MIDRGFVQIPRSILEDPHYNSMPLIYRAIFIKLLELVAYGPTYTDVHGKRVNILPFQVCISMRRLAEETGKEVNKDHVNRALGKFAQINYARHITIHDRCLITITHPDIYKEKNTLCETDCTTGARQQRDIKEENKKINIKDNSLRSLSKKAEPEKISIAEFVKVTSEELEKLQLEFGSALTPMVDKLNSYKGSTGKRYRSDYHTLRGWVKDKILEEKNKKELFKKPSHLHVKGAGATYPKIEVNEGGL